MYALLRATFHFQMLFYFSCFALVFFFFLCVGLFTFMDPISRSYSHWRGPTRGHLAHDALLVGLRQAARERVAGGGPVHLLGDGYDRYNPQEDRCMIDKFLYISLDLLFVRLFVWTVLIWVVVLFHNFLIH
jgi:hypothetical protein